LDRSLGTIPVTGNSHRQNFMATAATKLMPITAQTFWINIVPGSTFFTEQDHRHNSRLKDGASLA